MVADNGVGMDRADVVEKLNQFARPKKPLRDGVKSSTGETLYIIGLYGVGFLAPMAVSEQVEVWTQKAKSRPIRWVYKAGAHFADLTDAPADEFARLRRRYGVATTPADAPGTIVVCKLTEAEEEDYRVESGAIRESLVRYSRLLRVPVYLNGERINDQSPPGSTPHTPLTTTGAR